MIPHVIGRGVQTQRVTPRYTRLYISRRCVYCDRRLLCLHKQRLGLWVKELWAQSSVDNSSCLWREGEIRHCGERYQQGRRPENMRRIPYSHSHQLSLISIFFVSSRFTLTLFYMLDLYPLSTVSAKSNRGGQRGTGSLFSSRFKLQ